jgi:hypothetical protein
MRARATTPREHGKVPGYVVDYSLVETIRDLWPELRKRQKELAAAQGYIGLQLKSTHRAAFLDRRSGQWWVSATYDGSPEQPAPAPELAPVVEAALPAPVAKAVPEPIVAGPAPAVSPDLDLAELLGPIVEKIGGDLRAKNAVLSAALAEEKSKNDALRKWIRELVDEQRLHAQKGEEILELTA